MMALQADRTARTGYKAFLATVPLLASLTPADLENMATMVTAESYKDGDVIIEQDSDGDAMFILQEGGAPDRRLASPRSLICSFRCLC
jgi:signal-transduction protein with cAMP-binding, CBS, and nucleotidyltransferase domain